MLYNLHHLPQTEGFLTPKTQEPFLSSQPDLGHSPSVLGAWEYPMSTPGFLGPLLFSQNPKELSRATEVTLPVHTSFFLQPKDSGNINILHKNLGTI